MSPTTKRNIELVYEGFLSLVSGFMIARVIFGDLTPWLLLLFIPVCILSSTSFAKKWESL